MTEIHKILIFAKRRPGMSREEFRDYYENRHVPLCMNYMGPATKRYFRRYVENDDLEYDVVTELWFDSRESRDMVLKYAGSGVLPDDVIADEEKLFDRPRTRFTAITECETDLSG